ncbi:hypothetical protein K504DRAFT_503676 [Pleomassaria siparia CBS 279.74]|uniref:BTB domain-containing protein n=1 Tax=Pleomassaria siparia CBS 279.74 TaxID=1314801 RepID=A0A6G1K6J7_9PLEO|nr:hypothetical protein K504DRAFT_503676 [Pleomassaria siparia CBS 279.74]
MSASSTRCPSRCPSQRLKSTATTAVDHRNDAPTQSTDVDDARPLEGSQVQQLFHSGEKVHFLVGSKPRAQTIIASSDVVRNLSKVWADLLRQHEKDHNSKAWLRKALLSKKSKPKPILLPEQDAEMMVMVLNIAHGRFEGVTTPLSFQQTLNLARIMHKFQTNELLAPFMQTWIAHHRESILTPGYEQWLFIAYQFGLEDDFLQLSNHLMLNCMVNEHGQLLNLAGDAVLEGHFPTGLLGELPSFSPDTRYEPLPI